MKELEPVKQLQDNTEEQIKFPKSLQAMGETTKPHNGMLMFSVDPKTLKAEEVKYKTTALPVKRNFTVRKKKIIEHEVVHNQVIFDPKKFYCWAINKKNAVKKFKKANHRV